MECIDQSSSGNMDGSLSWLTDFHRIAAFSHFCRKKHIVKSKSTFQSRFNQTTDHEFEEDFDGPGYEPTSHSESPRDISVVQLAL